MNIENTKKIKCLEVSKNPKRELVSNSINSPVDFNYLENIKAVYEIRRIIQKKSYSIQDVWAAYNDQRQN